MFMDNSSLQGGGIKLGPISKQWLRLHHMTFCQQWRAFMIFLKFILWPIMSSKFEQFGKVE